jgi:hypothetical protein
MGTPPPPIMPMPFYLQEIDYEGIKNGKYMKDRRTPAEKNLQAVTDWLEGKINDEELKERIEV